MDLTPAAQVIASPLDDRMACFYFDESIHPGAGFILGTSVAWRDDPTQRINDVLLQPGLQPGVQEFKSGARMLGNASMARAVRVYTAS
jgi:hypothetical protein